jgi:hypothetical protein
MIEERGVGQSSFRRVGAFCAGAAGVITLAAAVVYLVLPADQRAAVGGAKLLPAVAEGAGTLKLEFVLLALVGVFGLGLVPALVRLVEEGSPGLVRWLGTLATVGYAVTSASYFFAMGRLPKLASAYVAGDESTRAALLAVWRSSLDLQGYWQFLAFGLFVVLVSILALRLARLPSLLCYLGLVVGVLSVLATIGSGASAPSFLTGVVSVATVLVPAWYIWTGVEMWRLGATG